MKQQPEKVLAKLILGMFGKVCPYCIGTDVYLLGTIYSCAECESEWRRGEVDPSDIASKM